MFLQPRLRLREIVSVDPEHGLSSTEICDMSTCHIDYCLLKNDQAWSVLHFEGSPYMYVKDLPDDILANARKEIDRILELESPIARMQYSKDPPFRVYQDEEKAVLINLINVRVIRPIAKNRTRFTFKKGYIEINLPIEWLDVPKTKVKEPIRRAKHANL